MEGTDIAVLRASTTQIEVPNRSRGGLRLNAVVEGRLYEGFKC